MPQPFVIKMAGNLWRQPQRGCQSWGTPPTDLGGWQGSRWPVQLVQDQRRRSELPDPSGTLCLGVPDGRRGVSSYSRRGRWPPKPFPIDSTAWIKWHVQQLDTSVWWPNLRRSPAKMTPGSLCRRCGHLLRFPGHGAAWWRWATTTPHHLLTPL